MKRKKKVTEGEKKKTVAMIGGGDYDIIRDGVCGGRGGGVTRSKVDEVVGWNREDVTTVSNLIKINNKLEREIAITKLEKIIRRWQ